MVNDEAKNRGAMSLREVMEISRPPSIGMRGM